MIRVLVLAFAYFVTGWLGLKLPYAGSHITLVWLPTGIAVAALLRWGWAVWPGVFLGALLVNLSIGSSWPLAAGIAVGNTLAPLLATGWLRHVGFLPAFDRQRDIGSFVLAACMGMVVSASGGCASLYLAGLMPGDAVGSAWLSWWMGDTVGVLLAAPLLLTLSRNSIDELRLAGREVLLWILVAGVVAWFAFLHDFEQVGGGLPLAFLPLPMLVWAALRFGNTGAAIAGLGFSMAAAWSTARGHGPFVLADVHTSLSLLWSYMATIVLMGLLIIALQAERVKMESSLRESELQLRTIIDTEPECVKMLDADGTLLQMNRAGLDMIEADSADQVVGGKMAGLILAPYRSAFSALTRRVFQGESGSIEFEMRGLKGTPRWLDSHVVPMRNVHGVVTAALGVTRDVTQRKLAEIELRLSEQRFSTAFSSCPVAASIAAAEDGRFMEANDNYERDFGWPRSELIGRTSVEVGIWPDQATRAPWVEAIRREGRLVNYETIWMHKNGERRNVSLSAEITELNGKTCILAYATDITARKRAEAELRIAATAFESQEGMVVTDPGGVILRVNKAFTEISGYSAAEVVGQTPRLLKSGRHDAAFYAAMWASLAGTGAWQGEVWDRRKSGEIFPKWLTISAVKGDDGVVTHYVGTHQDITERKKAEERIQELAFFDSLTRLPNRTLLLDRLKQAMTAGNRNGTFGAVLFIDLDHFKTLNDTLGHDKGDLLLQQVAQRLAASVREGDTVARLGGDEFVMVLGSLNKTVEEAANETEAVGEKILAVLNQTYLLGDIDYRSTASIGATLFRGHETSIEDLLKQADLAMYRSKATGRNGLHFFDPAMQTVVVERVALETGLRKAIEGNQLLLHYQAQVDGAGRVMGAEALVRWQHPERGMVSPAEFIPLAEETGLILPLGQWVLETACVQLALWAIRPEMAHLTVAVNMSAQEFRDPDFVLKVVAILNQTGANPNRLKLELTESLLVDNVEDVIETMFALKARGVGFSLDDFGTGYSSLSYLKRLPLDQLKIDQSFVRDILIDPNDAAIARTIVALAQSLGLGVIAEGVETETQRAFLASSGCHAYQGYFFSRPLPVEGFEEFVRRA